MCGRCPSLHIDVPLENHDAFRSHRLDQAKILGQCSSIYDDVPLEHEDSIRLLRLQFAAGSSTPTYKLYSARLGIVAKQYDALSYTWGPKDETKIIKVNDSFISIQRNLHDFLRTHWTPITIWVDAICIDQRSDNEKNHQVNLMQQIYSSARQTCVWLGIGMTTYQALIKQALEERPEWGGRYFEPHNSLIPWSCPPHNSLAYFKPRRVPTETLENAFTELLTNPYWARLWIVQEVALAKRVTVYIGEWAFDWEEWTWFWEAIRFELEFRSQWSGHQRHRSHFLWNLKMARNRQWQVELGLPQLLEYYGNTLCQDLRDRVFGVLGLLTKHDDPLYEIYILGGNHEVLNYSMSLVDLFGALMRLYAERPFGEIAWFCGTRSNWGRYLDIKFPVNNGLLP